MFFKAVLALYLAAIALALDGDEFPSHQKGSTFRESMFIVHKLIIYGSRD